MNDQDNRQYKSPRDEYVYSPTPVSLNRLTAKWHSKGQRDGHSRACLLERARRERWADARETVQTRSELEADRIAAESLAEARTRLLSTARHLQTLGMEALTGTPTQEPTCAIAGAAIALRALRIGAELELRVRGEKLVQADDDEKLHKWHQLLEELMIPRDGTSNPPAEGIQPRSEPRWGDDEVCS